MLPSKGYFSSLPCPFFDSGHCGRQHCHFRHCRKDKAADKKDASEISNTCNDQNNENSTQVTEASQIIPENIKEAVVLPDSEKTLPDNETNELGNELVASAEDNLEGNKDSDEEVPSYKPTPISELNKRHIPVVYAPTTPCMIDRFRRRKEIESLLYSPKCLSSSNIVTPSSTYVPTSNAINSCIKTDMYVPNSCTSYTYCPSIIPKAVSKTVSKINMLNNEDKLKALDELIEEEFGSPKEVPTGVSENVEVPHNLGPSENHPTNTQAKESLKVDEKIDNFKASTSLDHSATSVTPNLNVSSSVITEGDKKEECDIRLPEKHAEEKKHSSSQKHNSSKKSSKDSKSKKESDKLKHKSKSSDNKHSKYSSSSESSSTHPRKHSDSNRKEKHKEDHHLKSKHSSDKHKSKKCVRHDKKRKSPHKEEKPESVKIKEKELSRHQSPPKSCKRHRSENNSYKEKESLEHTEVKRRKTEHHNEIFSLSDSNSSSSTDIEEIITPKETIVIDSSSNSSSDSSNDRTEPYIDRVSLSEPEPLTHPKKIVDFLKTSSVSVSDSQNILCERWRKARETVLMKNSIPGKIKIAQVRNVSSILNAKDLLFSRTKKAPEISKVNAAPLQDEEYVPKPPARKAHTPSEAAAKYPVIIMEENLKVPVSIRQPCLNNIFDEYRKFCDIDMARIRAQEDELEICRRLHVTKTYQNAVALTLLRIRKNKGAPSNQDNSMETKTCSGQLRSDSVPDYTYGWTLYQCFAKYILTEEEYISNGFPIQKLAQRDCGYIETSARRPNPKQPKDSSMRICSHCSKNYFVDDDGFPLEENDCFYHWGRLRRVRVCGGFTEIYICCGAEVGSEPCSSGRYHVCNLYDDDHLEGFVSTRPQRHGKVDKAGIYALDCEMCYTTKGLDLTRCTLVDLNGKVVYDEIVVPECPVLDYCTRFSGMTEELIKGAKLKLKDVQRDILKLVNEKTILVGHSLENDMKALRIFHKTLVDTSVVFPHQLGLPFKHALKRIAKDILNISIQDKESGHDSFEDANTCMQIMMWKIKEDAKGRKPRVIISLNSKGTPTVSR